MNTKTAALVQTEIRSYKDPIRASHSQKFFKTYEGGYAEGDKFLGLTVPLSRKVAKNNNDLPLTQILKLLSSDYHEDRLIALFIMVSQFEKGDESTRKTLYSHYLKSTRYINNWDLVDSSAHKIVGAYLVDKNKDILFTLAKSNHLWERRIAIIATLWFIKEGSYETSLQIAQVLLSDKHDLIHKAVGWMLREIGKSDRSVLDAFLLKHYKSMPRTMLRYAIEKHPEKLRKKYLHGTI